AGREQTAGEVYLQTYMPEHHVMQALLKGGRDQFMELEAEMREDAAMPPYGKLAAVIVEGKDEGEVTAFMRDLANAGSKMQIDGSPLILGPAPAPLTRISGKYRYRILIKAGKNFPLRQWLADWLLTRTIPAKFKLKIDVEPYNFM
ncbi:MAG: primosomal protein N', partial [Pseudomonadota bacterium]